MILSRQWLSLAATLAFLFVFTGTATAQHVDPHPPGTTLNIDPDQKHHPQIDNQILKCCADYWQEIKTLGQAYHLKVKGEVKVLKIIDPKYDFAVIYKGDCVVITLSDSHY